MCFPFQYFNEVSDVLLNNKDNSKLVDIINNNVLYEEYFTQQSIDSMAESKDIVICEEDFEKLVASFTKILRDKGISETDLTNTDIMKFVAVVNIENLDPELIEVLRGDETASQFITEAMTITGHITAYNRNYYNQNHNTLGFINVSDAFLEESYGTSYKETITVESVIRINIDTKEIKYISINIIKNSLNISKFKKFLISIMLKKEFRQIRRIENKNRNLLNLFMKGTFL